MPKKPIPKFSSYEEEAEFWDTHDATDYFTFKRPKLAKGVTVRLDPATLAAVSTRAEEQGVGPSTLIRMWVRERIASTRRRKRA